MKLAVNYRVLISCMLQYFKAGDFFLCLSLCFLFRFLEKAVKDNVRAGGLFRQNRPTASTLSDIMQVQQMSRKYARRQRRFHIWQNFRCTRLYTNTRSSTTWRIADQTRTFICVFLRTCTISQRSIPITHFENEMKGVFSCTASQRWSCELREHCCWIRLRQLKKVIGAAGSCASWSTLVRWAERRRWPGVPSESKLKVHGRCAFSFECKIEFRKLFVGSPGNQDSNSNTKIAKVAQAVQTVFFGFLFFLFFFYYFAFFFGLKADPQANETKKRSRSYIPVVHSNSKLALATTCTLRVLSQ